jgi:beta-glucosidase
MMSTVYIEHLGDLVMQGTVKMSLIDDAVTRILRVKAGLGLFRDPYRYCDEPREKERLFHLDHRKMAQDVARKSIVLLKNDHRTLPLQKDIKRIALIGPLADNQADPMGSWSAKGEVKDIVTLRQGIRDAVSPDTEVVYAQGCSIDGNDTDSDAMAEAVGIAQQADVIVAALGESREMSGEAKCRGDIGLPGQQLALLKQLHATGKPVVLVLMNGRPLTLVWPSENIPAILETWLLGTQAGPAIADILFGDANPSGKLPVTFPYALGQVPIFYNHKMGGRPPVKDQAYRSTYLDMPFEPLYPFGFGLSYTEFTYGPIRLSQAQTSHSDTIQVSITLTNAGAVAGAEVVQLYIRDVQASVTRPVKELKGFQKIQLDPGESRDVTFTLTTKDLAFYNQQMQRVAEPGTFQVFVGGNSRDLQKTEFILLDK